MVRNSDSNGGHMLSLPPSPRGILLSQRRDTVHANFFYIWRLKHVETMFVFKISVNLSWAWSLTIKDLKSSCKIQAYLLRH
jgi:hypothetical protein